MPQRLPTLAVRRIGTDQSGNDGGADLAAMDIRPVQKVEVVIGVDMGAGLQPDDGAKTLGMLERKMQASLGKYPVPRSK